jgi:hypothetical protein
VGFEWRTPLIVPMVFKFNPSFRIRLFTRERPVKFKS